MSEKERRNGLWTLESNETQRKIGTVLGKTRDLKREKSDSSHSGGHEERRVKEGGRALFGCREKQSTQNDS